MKKNFSVWTLFSDDDDVRLYLTKAEALKAKKYWEKCAANDIRGPFEHSVTVKVKGKEITLQ